MSLWNRLMGKKGLRSALKEKTPCTEPAPPSDSSSTTEAIAERIRGKQIEILVKYSELDSFVSPVLLNLCAVRHQPMDLSRVINAVCPHCGAKINPEWLQVTGASLGSGKHVFEGRDVGLSHVPKGCPRCEANSFKAIFVDITAEEIQRLGKDPYFSRLSGL